MGKMTKKDLITTLSKYSNGGNAFLLFEYLNSFNLKEVNISQKQIGIDINKTRPAIQSSLELLQEIGVVELYYGKIIIKIEVLNG
jgi:acetolactate synthase small subunit